MKNNIKIFALTALFALVGFCCAFSANAQSRSTTYHEVDGVGYYENILANNGAVCIKTAGTHVESLVGDGVSLSGQQYGNMENSTPNYMGYKVFVLDSEGNGTDITDELSIEYGLPLYTEKSIYSFGSGKSRFDRTILHVAEFRPAALPQQYYGKTIKVQLLFGGITKATINNLNIVENFYMDVVDAPKLLYNGASAGETKFPYDGGTDYQAFVCKGEQIFFKLDNTDYPLGEEASYLGNKYKADYAWDLNTSDINDIKIPSESQTSFKTNSKRILDAVLTTGDESRIFHFMPSVQFKLNGNNVCLNRKPLNPIFSVYYTTPLEAMIEVSNATSGSAYTHVDPESDLETEPAITVCDGDDVNVRYSYLFDGNPHDYFEATLYEIDKDGNVLSTVASYKYTDDDNIEDVFTIPALSAPKKNKLYYYSIVVEDINFEDYNDGHNCEGERVDFSVKVLEKGAKVTLQSDGSHCEGDNVEIKMSSVSTLGNVADYTYQLKRKKKGKDDDTAVDIPTNDGGNKTSFTVIDNGVPDGDFVYMMYIKNQGACEYKAGEINVSVAAAPVLSVSDITICKGEEAVLALLITNTAKQPEGSTYTYKWTAGMSGTDANKSATFNKKVSPKPLTTTSYTVIATNDKSHCPSSPFTATVTVSLPPDIEAINGVDASCLNSDVTLTATLSSSYTPVVEPIVYTWTRMDGTTPVEEKDGESYTYKLDKEYNVVVSATDGNSCTSLVTKDKTVTINPLPDFAPSAEETCSGDSWNIKMNKADARALTYTFSSATPGAPAIATTTSDNFTVVSPSDVASQTQYVYTVKGTDENGCSDTKELILVVNPLPQITKLEASKTSQCLGTSVTLTATANSRASGDKKLTYEWYDGSTKLSGTLNKIDVNPAVAGLHTYSVTVTDSKGCTKTESVSVTFFEITTVEVDADKSEICVGEEVNLTATLGAGANASDYDFLWSEGSTTQNITVTPSATATYSVTITQKLTGCIVNSADKVITVNQLPEFTMKFSTEVCNGVPTVVNLNMTPKSGVPAPSTYTWVSGGSASDFVATSDKNVLEASKAWTSSTVYTYYATSAKGCKSANVSAELVVNPIPATPALTATPNKICKGVGESVTLAVTSPDPALDYFWYTDAGCTSSLNGSTAKTSTTLTKDQTAALTSSTTYYVKGIHKTTGCETAVASVTLDVNTIPAAELTIDNSEYCVDTKSSSITVSIAEPGTYTYKWTAVPADPGLVSTNKDITVSPKKTTVYTLVAKNTDTGCETEAVSKTVTVNQLPKFTMALDEDQVCDGKVTELTLTMTPTAASATVGAVDHYEYVSGGSASDFVKQSDNVYIANKAWTSNTTYVYKAVTATGCMSETKSVTIKVNPIPAVPVVSVSPAQICKGADNQVTLTVTNAEAGVNYFWYSDPSCTAPLNDGKAAKSFSPSKASTSALTGNTVYYVKAVNSTTKCDNETIGNVTLVVNSIPAATLSVVNPEFCVGTGSATITATMGDAATYTYKWTSLPAGYSATTKDITVSPTETTTYTLVATNTTTGCKTEEASETITVNQKPTFTIAFDSEVCSGEEATVKMTMSTSDNINDYTAVSGTPAFTKVSKGVYTATSTWTSDTEYSFTAESDKGCVSLPVKATLKVNAHPAAPEFTMTPAAICVDDATPSVVLSVVDPVSTSIYEWYQGSTKLGVGQSYTITTNPGVDTEYSVREISGSTCTGDFASKTLKVNQLPTVTITGTLDPCLGESITLTANPVAGGAGTFAADAYTWYADGVVISGENANTLTVTPSKNTKYSVMVTESTGCGSALADANVTIKSRPAFTITADPSFVCEGIETTVKLTMTKTGVSPDIASYSLSEGDPDFAMESLGVYKATKSWSADATYAFTAVAANGCSSTESVPVTIEVNAKPETPILNFGNSTICQGTEGPIEVTIQNFKTGMKYTVRDAADNIIVEDHTSKKFNITTAPTVKTTYTIIGVAGDNCFTDKGSYDLDVVSKPTVTIAGDASICEGQETTLEATVVNGAVGSDLTYEWRILGEAKVRGNHAKITVSPEETTTYELTVTEIGAATCDVIETFTVAVEKKPIIAVSADNADFCADVEQTVVLTVAPVAGSAPVVSYEWFNANNVSKGTGATLSITDVWSEGHYRFYAIATSAESNACKSDPSDITINVNPIPTKPIVETDKASICKYATGTEDVVAKVNNVESGYKYTWYDAADNKIAEGNEVTIPVKNDGANQSFYVIATDENFVTNCNSPKTTFTINVVELPDAPVISGQNEYCLNDASHATTLKVDNEDPSLTYKWFVGDVLVGEGVTFTTPAHLDATTVYYAKAYNATGCESLASNDQTISIVNNPVLSSLDASEIQVCPGMPSTRTIEVFSANGDNVFFKWTLDGSVVLETTVEGTSSKYTFESTEQTGTFNLKVEAWTSYKSCPAEPLNFKLTIKDFEDLQFKVNGIDYTEGKVYDLCQGTTANIVFSNLGGVSYKIVDKNNVEVFNTSESSVSMTVTDDNDYTIIKYTGDCVSPIEQHFSIAVKKQVLFDLSAPQSACLGTELVLEAVNIDFQGNDETKVDYQWFLNGTAIAGANGTTYTVDEVTAAHGGVYALTVTTEFDCTTTHEVTLDVHTIPAIVWDEEVSTNILCLDGGEKYLGIKPADGNEAPLANTLWDINTLDFGVVNTNDKISVKATSPTQYDGQVLTVRAYAVDANGCQSVGISRDLTVVASPVITSVTDAEGHIDEFHLCAGNDLTLTVNSTPATGDYVYFYSKDGVDLDWNSPVMNFTSITSDMAGTYTVEILDNASGCTSSVYTFTIDFPVPSAELQILPASKLVIAGSEVKATVTAGHDHYVFFVNGVEQTEGLFGNELIFYPKETSTVSVNVYNEYGCYITLNDEVEVLEGILKKNVIATPESYCSTERATGSVISVEDPQEGVTYTLTRVDDGVQIGEPITAVYGQPVEWTTIQTILETTLDDVEYSNTFEITARHEELPGIVETMANRVVVTEVYGYTPELITPSGTSENCGGTFKIENAVVGFKYVIYHDGEVFGEVEKADSKTIEFTQLLQFTGKYVVKRFYSRNNVCGEYTLDTYEIAEPDLTKVIISADNKDYGYYCKQDGKNGVDLSIQATTADQEYTLFYQKTLADVAEPVTVLADGVTELKIVGNGLDLIIGNTADIKGDGFYSLGYMQNDCIQLTSKNIMEVVGYSAPAKDDFVVSSSSDVTSYFCEGTTFPVSVADKNGDKIAKYLEFHLVQEKPVYDDTFPVLEGIDTDTEAFQIANGGTYHIEVVNTNLQKLGLTCANTVLDKFTLVRLDKPAPIKAEFANDDFCLDSEGNAQDILTLRLLAPDVYYTVFDKNGIAKDVANNELVFTDAHGTGTKSFMMPLTAGKNTFTVKAQRKAGAVECEIVEVASTVVTVRPRPEVGSAVVTWNTDRKDAGIECAGVDVVVKNTTEGMLYTLYVDGDSEPFIDGGYDVNSPKSSAVSDGNDITFYNIGVNAKFYVTVNYPDAVATCAEKVGDVDITANEITYVQPSLTNPNVCQGEGFTQVRIKGVKESDLDNYVYKVVTYKTDADGNQIEKVLSSTLNSGDYEKPFVGDYLVFTKHYASNAKLDIKVTKKVTVDPEVITESCPVQLGHIEFKVNKLPKSFELTGRSIYCGGKSDIQLILPTSETGVEYVLYVYDGDDLVEYEYEDANGVSHRVAVDGEDGMSVEFPKFSTTDPRFLDKGKYTVIAINKITGCTSAMMNEVEVVNQPSIIVKDVVNGDYESCSNDATFVEIEAKDTQKDVTYYFYHTEDAAEIHRLETGITEDMLAAIVEDQDNADGLIIRKYTGKNITCLPRISGNYVVLASYDMYACPVFLDKFSYTSYRLDKYVFTASAQCGSEIKYTLGGTQEDVTYQIVSTSGKNIGDPFIGNGSEYSINIDNEITDPNEEVFIIASIGTCQEEMAGRFKPATLVMEEPTGTFDFFVEGSKWDRTNPSLPEICSSSNVTMLAKINDEIGITKYSYEFFKLVENVDPETGESDIKHEFYTNSQVSTNVLIQNFEGFDPSQTYHVVLRVSSDNCGPFAIDSIDFKIKGSTGISSKFLPDDEHVETDDEHMLGVHGAYCPDEEGVRLYYQDPEKGSIYRLYKNILNEEGVESIELVDMQEIPNIPGYILPDDNRLWFSGWGANNINGQGSYADATEEGTSYFVTVQQSDGCVLSSDPLYIFKNPLPFNEETNKVYYAPIYVYTDENGVERTVPNPDESTHRSDYGLVNVGYVVLSNDEDGVIYRLLKAEDPEFMIEFEGEDDGMNVSRLITSEMGPGTYEFVAYNPNTKCVASVGSVTFIDEELEAFNVYLYMGKDQNMISQLLYPSPANKGNEKYISWSSQVDNVWCPYVVDDLTGEMTDVPVTEDLYDGYLKDKDRDDKAYVVFQMDAPMKEEVSEKVEKITEEKYNELGAESNSDLSAKLYETIIDLVIISDATDDEGNPVHAENPAGTEKHVYDEETGEETKVLYYNLEGQLIEGMPEGAEPIGDGQNFYHYYQVIRTVTLVPDVDAINATGMGMAGFDDDHELATGEDIVEESRSGLFRFIKAPGFFGTREYTYHIYNDKMKNFRTSNPARIVILCGNNLTPDGKVFLVPNAFSPNGDGINDEFRIIFPAEYGEGVAQTQLEVFNRWGTRVYKSSGLNYGGPDCPYWDGTSTTSNMVTVGEKLPSGTYYYVLTIKIIDVKSGNAETLDLKGFIELRR